MGAIDLEHLLSPVTEESPSGDDLEYDAGYLELERLSRGKPEQQMGDEVIPAETPDWKSVGRLALELAGRTKDLRVGVILAQSMIATEGFRGFADGLALLHGYVDRFWDSVHPKLDPADPDPILRVNALSALSVFDPTLRMLREAPLVSPRGIGPIAYRDVLIASNKIEAPADLGREPVSMAMIRGAFEGAGPDVLGATAAALDAALAAATAIETSVTSRVGAALSVDLGDLAALLRGARQSLAEALGRGGPEEPDALEEAGSAAGPSGRSSGGAAGSGEIRSRDDVVRALDRICAWFERNEPSSPVPLLLVRAKRLTNKSFVEIVRDLAPDGLGQVEMIRGREEE